MKKYLLILLATMAFVSCNDEVEEIDYSTWTVEELLATGGGINYLVSQTKEINYNELNERLKTEVLSYGLSSVFMRQGGVWMKEFLDGVGSGGYMVLMEDNTFRRCYEYELTPYMGMRFYQTHDAYDNAVAEMVGKMKAWSKIVAYAGDTLVIEYEHGDYRIPTRFLAHFADCRESVLNNYANNWDDPASWIDEYLKRFE